uniref:C2H2-type domain-containing protein n=1 Tax=Gouania willdenowi TaxID=441366 RepID=A0A8C5EAE2_GOUWI
MSTTVSLKEFIIERLTAAAADIFSACEQTILRYEEEIDRQRRLLEINIKQHNALATDTCFTVDPQDQMIHDQDEPKPPLNEEDRVNINLKIEEEPEKSEPETESTSTSEKPDQSEAEGQSGNLLSHSSDVEIQSKPAESGSYVQALKFNINGKNKMRKISQRQQEKENEKLRLFQTTSWVCKICGKTLICKNNLIIHMRIHTQERPYTCSVCGMRFFQTSHLKRHKHTGLRAFTCDICGERFPLRRHLVKHMKTHQSENLPYVCTTCGKGFFQLNCLNQHKITHTNLKPFSCKTCNKQFRRLGHLFSHVRIHTGEKPFSCKMCEKKFSRQCSLRRHVRTHTKERPYSCDICEKTYVQATHLTQHKLTHTGHKRFSCQTCAKAYFYPSDLLRHKKKLHS